MAFVLALIV